MAGPAPSGPIGTVAIARTATDDARFRALVAARDADMVKRFSDVSVQALPNDSVDGLTTAVLALAGDRAIGCGCLAPLDATTGELKRMFVVPDLRGRGIAARLVGALEDWARELGLGRLVVATYVLQRDVLALYRHLGYADIAPFGPYVRAATSVCLARTLAG